MVMLSDMQGPLSFKYTNAYLLRPALPYIQTIVHLTRERLNYSQELLAFVF